MKELLVKSLSQKIERLEVFEERMKIRLENISLKLNDDNEIKIFCEVHPTKGTKINENTKLECVLYNKEGSILEVESCNIYSDDFFGFEILEFMFSEIDDIDNIGKIRIYPKKW